MIEFWQAGVLYVLASVVTTAGACGVAYLNHRWTAQRASDAEERAARRELRSEQVRPILDFLAAARSYSAQSDVNDIIQKMQDDHWPLMRDGFAKTNGISVEQADKLFRDESEKWPTDGNSTQGLGGLVQLSQVLFSAAQAAPEGEILPALTLVFNEAMNPGTSPGAHSQATSLLDDYIVRGEELQRG